MALATLGLTFLITGEPARARELLEQALAIQTAAGYPWGEGQARLYLGIDDRNDRSTSRFASLPPRVECFQHYRDTNLLANALIGQAGLIARRDPAVALRVTAAAVSVRVRVHGDFPGFFGERMRRIRAGCEAALGTDADRIWAEGSRLGIDEAIALAFGDLPAACAGSRRPEHSRAGGGPAGGRRPRQQGDRRAAASLRAHGREPRPPRARQSRAEQPHATCEVGARAQSVAAQ